MIVVIGKKAMERLEAKLDVIKLKVLRIVMTQEELVSKLDANTAIVEKVRTEIAALKDVIAKNPVSQPVVDAVARLEAAIGAADADNPDVPPPA